MPDPKLQQCIQAALSYRDKARRLCAECEAAFAAGRLDRALYEREHGAYAAHLRMAEKRLQELRAAGVPEISRLGRRLQRALARRRTVSGGTPAHARMRKLSALDLSIERLRADVAWHNALLSADSPNEAGGYVDLPLEKYARHARPRGTEFSLTRSNAILVAIAGTLLVVAVISTYVVFTPGRGLSITAARVAKGADILSLRCANAGNRPVTLYVPWGNHRNHAERGAYGVDIYLSEESQHEFRLWQDAVVWYYEGRAMRDRDAIAVPPFLEAEIRFNLAQIRKAEPKSVSIKFVVSDWTGHPLYSGVF